MKNSYETKVNNANFENIKHIDEFENECWYARELMILLEYKKWKFFEDATKKLKLKKVTIFEFATKW